MSQLFDCVIVGGGIAGVRAAQAAAKNGLTYKVLEANSYLGGRILTETLPLGPFQRAGATQLPSIYKFEHGAGWIHGTNDNPLVDIFKSLYEKYETEKFEDQLADMFPGNAWIMPEYASYEHFTMVDGPTCHQFTKEEYDIYIAIVCIHLRDLLRKYNGLKLSQFVQPYMEWIATNLATNEKTKENAEIIARGVGWYFHSVEAYSGTPKGLMSASDLFVQVDTVRPLLDDIDYDIEGEVLNEESAKELLELVNNASQIDMKKRLEEYLKTPHALADAALQGCYLGDHSTLKCGMGKLVELFKKDVENTSDALFNVDLYTKVTGIEYPDNNGKVVTGNTPGMYGLNRTPSVASSNNGNIYNSPPSKKNIVVEISQNDDDVESKIFDIKDAMKSFALPPASCEAADASTATITFESNSPTESISPEDGSYNAIVSAQNVQTGEEIKYYARYAVICTASVHSILQNIKFPQDSQGDEAKTVLADSTCSVYYKKVLFCFPEQWWDNKKFTRLFALTQDAINFKKQRCKHCNDNTPRMADEEYTSLDVSQGAYPCLFDAARDELMLTTTSCSDNDDDDDDESDWSDCSYASSNMSTPSFTSQLSASNSHYHSNGNNTPQQRSNASNTTPIAGFTSHKPTPTKIIPIVQSNNNHNNRSRNSNDNHRPHKAHKLPKLKRDSTLLYLERTSTMNFTPISFCGVNMIWESHIYNKSTPVLSASIVGNLAEHCVGLDDNLVKMIVFKQLEKIYRSTVAVKRSSGDFDFPSAIPKPLWSRVTHWGENPHILQSYSLITDCTFSTEERITLAQDQHLYFAGEALHVEHGGSVHGAIFSADYAVEKVLEKYCGVEPDAAADSLHSFGLLDASPSLSCTNTPKLTCGMNKIEESQEIICE